MKKYMGIWMDAKKALVVSFKINGSTEIDYDRDLLVPKILHLESDVDEKLKMAGGSRTRKTAYGPQNIDDDKKMKRRRESELHHYYDTIISRIKNADKVLILGPGDAKTELKKQVDASNKLLSGKIKLKTTDKMTENQVVAEIRAHFEL